MRGRIVALQAGYIGNFIAKSSCLGDVANLAAFAEYGVGERKWTAAVDLLPGGALSGKPSQGKDRNCKRKPEPPAAKGMRPREILQIDPLG